MITWFQIPCADFDRAVRFYESLLSTEMPRDKDPRGNDMAVFLGSDGAPIGAVNSDPRLSASEAGPRIYLGCPDGLDATMARGEAAGGKVAASKQEIPGWGHVAAMADPEGNIVGLSEAAS